MKSNKLLSTVLLTFLFSITILGYPKNIPLKNFNSGLMISGYSEKTISVKDLPAKVKKVITGKFGKNIEYLMLKKVIRDKKTTYKIQLRKGEKDYELIINPAGKILLLKEIIRFETGEEDMGC